MDDELGETMIGVSVRLRGIDRAATIGRGEVMASILEFALAVVGAVFILGCLGVVALVWLTADRTHSTHRQDKW